MLSGNLTSICRPELQFLRTLKTCFEPSKTRSTTEVWIHELFCFSRPHFHQKSCTDLKVSGSIKAWLICYGVTSLQFQALTMLQLNSG